MSSLCVYCKCSHVQCGEGSTLHWNGRTLNWGTGGARLLFTSSKLTTSNSNCVVTDVLILPRCSMREAHSISGQWKTVECFWVDMPTYMYCQISTGLGLIWGSCGLSFCGVGVILCLLFIYFFLPHLSCVSFRWGEHEAFWTSTSVLAWKMSPGDDTAALTHMTNYIRFWINLPVTLLIVANWRCGKSQHRITISITSSRKIIYKCLAWQIQFPEEQMY